MKILFLLGMYHPRSSANGLCCKNIVDECVRNGWDVSCVVNAYQGNTSKYELDGATIYPIKPRLSYQITEWCETHPTSRWKKVLSVCAALLNKTRLALRAHTWPYISPSYTRAFYRKAEKLHKREQFDVVVAVYTPIDSLYAGYKLKNKFQDIKFVPYYLDALAGGWGPSKWSPEKKDKRLRMWEQRIAAKADAIISMESSKAYHVQNPLSEELHKKRVYLDVPMMLPSIPAEDKNGVGKYAIFAGNISYPRRNPIPLLKAFMPVCNELNVELFFVGECNNKEIFEPYIQATNGRIRLLGQKNHGEVLELEKKASFLVNIGSENPYTIPCKIFEYMRFGKPVISTYAIDNEPSIECLKKYGCVHFFDERVPLEESSALLRAFIENTGDVKISDEFCQQIFYKNTPRAFADTLRKIMEETI